MNSLANEMTAKAIMNHRLQRAEATRVAAIVVAQTRGARTPKRRTSLRVAIGGRIEALGRRLAGSREPAAVDHPC